MTGHETQLRRGRVQDVALRSRFIRCAFFVRGCYKRGNPML